MRKTTSKTTTFTGTVTVLVEKQIKANKNNRFLNMDICSVFSFCLSFCLFKAISLAPPIPFGAGREWLHQINKYSTNNSLCFLFFFQFPSKEMGEATSIPCSIVDSKKHIHGLHEFCGACQIHSISLGRTLLFFFVRRIYSIFTGPVHTIFSTLSILYFYFILHFLSDN